MGAHIAYPVGGFPEVFDHPLVCSPSLTPRLMLKRSLWILLPACACVRVFAAESAPQAPSIDTVEKTVTAWVNTRAETSKLASAWAIEQPLAESTALALEQRAKTAEEKAEQLRAKTAEQRTELGALEGKNHEASDALVSAEKDARELQQQVLALRDHLPPRLQAALTLPYQSLSNPDLPPGDRMQFTLTIINRCLQFNHGVTYGEESLAINGGVPQIYEVIYWGLSRGYALDRKSTKGWVGAPTSQGWRWETVELPAVPRIETLIAAYNDKAEPALAELPARVLNVAETKGTP